MANLFEDDTPISKREWNGLLDACDRAGVKNWELREVIAEATGIPKSIVGTVDLTRSQYRRAMDFLANYQGKRGATR